MDAQQEASEEKMSESEDRKQRFAAAFPWWAEGKAKHGWEMKVELKRGATELRRGGSLLALKHDPTKDGVLIDVRMPGATKEQEDALLRGLKQNTVRFSPPQEREQNKSDAQNGERRCPSGSFGRFFSSHEHR
jgi:hypothetical protein